MSELFASIKAFIEKGNIIVFLLAVAAAIFSYQMLSKELLWALFVFCIAYAVFYGINSLYNSHQANIRQEAERKNREEAEFIRKREMEAQVEQQKMQNEAHLRTIYDSLPEDIKDGLIKFYQLPQPDGGFSNSRILFDDEFLENQTIINAFQQISFTIGLGREDLVDIRPSVKSKIYLLMPEFYHIIEEKAKAKGK